MPGFMRVLVLAAIAAIGPVGASALAQERIVSVGGDLTEIIYALGAGERIVATDSTSVYPEAANETAKVGYVRRLSAEGVLSVEPDLIMISGAARPEEALAQIRASGVDLVEMEADYTIEGIIEKTRAVAKALDMEAEGAAFADEIESDWNEAKAVIAELDVAPSMLFFAAPPKGDARGAGTETAAHGVIELLGGRNVFADHAGYKALSLEAAVAADPDIILVMSHHADRMGGVEKVYQHPALSLTTAAKERRIFFVDQVAVMQFGPRTPKAIADLAKEIAAGNSTAGATGE